MTNQVQISTIASNSDFKVNLESGEAFISQRKTAEITGVPAATIRDWLKADREKSDDQECPRTYIVNENNQIHYESLYQLLLSKATTRHKLQPQVLEVLRALHSAGTDNILELPANVPKAATQKIRDTSGFLYILESQDFIKIGCSKYKDVSERVSALQTGNPFKINVLMVHPCKNMFRAENNTHHYYKNEHVRGEWFKIDDLEKLYQFVSKIK